VAGRGFHIALAREHAKTLFSLKEDNAIHTFLDELKVRPDMKKSGRVLDVGTLWDPIHRCLTEGELDPTAGDFPLNTAGGQLGFGQAGLAGGMHHVCDATRQIMGRAGQSQVPDCHRAFVSGNGGILSEQTTLILEGD